MQPPTSTSSRRSRRSAGAELPRRHRLLGDLVRERERAARARQPQVVVGEHAQPEVDLGPDRVQRRVERLLGDRELGERTGSTRLAPQTNSVSGAWAGSSRSTPSRGQHLVGDHERRLRVERASPAPPAPDAMPAATSRRRRVSSWSVASISTSSVIVSCGGPVRRSASPRSPPSPPALRPERARRASPGCTGRPRRWRAG